VLSATYSALASFLTAYHVHEKAILTTLLPLTVWAVGLAQGTTKLTTTTMKTAANRNNNKKDASSSPLILLAQTTAAAVLGLGPLLFRPVEMLLKVVTLTPYLAALVHLCQEYQDKDESSSLPVTETPGSSTGQLDNFILTSYNDQQ
jgi:hypothetical protein